MKRIFHSKAIALGSSLGLGLQQLPRKQAQSGGWAEDFKDQKYRYSRSQKKIERRRSSKKERTTQIVNNVFFLQRGKSIPDMAAHPNPRSSSKTISTIPSFPKSVPTHTHETNEGSPGEEQQHRVPLFTDGSSSRLLSSFSRCARMEEGLSFSGAPCFGGIL